MTPSLAKPDGAPASPPGPIAPTSRPPEWAVLSDQGRQRGNNEDAWGAFALDGEFAAAPPTLAVWPSHGILFVISDGMGGARAGEEASRFCVERLASELHARLATADAGAVMREAFVATHAALVALSRTNPNWMGMGATLSALWLRPAGDAILGHVGDSRIYGCREGRWRQWTDDHTLGAGLVRRGGLTAEMAARFKFRALLEQVMGGDGRPVEPQISTTPWQAGDAFALCSDGLYRPLADGFESRLSAALQPAQLAAGAAELVDAANSAGGPDNITVLLARLA